MNPRTCFPSDVAIVGAGPAGARAAWMLARRGARVAIFDASHPREKPCGGGITGRALDLIVDAVSRREIDAVAVRSARFVHADGVNRRDAHEVAAAVDLEPGSLVVSSRRVFDAALLSAAVSAGATHLPLRVLDLSFEQDGVTLKTTSGTHRAGFVIGADGANSLVRRRVAQMFRRDQLSIAAGYFADGATSQEIVVEFVPDPPGYLWSFPRSTHLGIGACAPAGGAASSAWLRRLTEIWIERSRITEGAALRAYSWPIPTLGAREFDRLELAGARWCLVGDAAGLVDPITREGIFFALASGQWAAEALAATHPARRYAARVRDEIVPELARAARLKPLFFRPAFTGQLLAALEASAAIRRVMGDLIAGQQSYATLKWRLLGTFEVGLAWKSLVELACRR